MVIEVHWILKFLAAVEPKTVEDNRVGRGWYDEG